MKPEFEAWLLARTPRTEWPTLNMEDLELAWSALEGNATSALEIERRLQRVAKSTAGKRGDDDFVEEVSQRVRQRLFVGSNPRLGACQGTGALVVYLKAMVLSVSVDLQRAAKPREEPSSHDSTLMRAASLEEGVDARLAHASHRKHFTQAFKEALEELSPEERTYMRMRFVDGLSIDAVGAAFGVHRTTALRWLEKAQKTLLAETRKRLAVRLKLGVSELNSLLLAMKPSLAENLSRLLPKLT
jgi:RNA polymerase sigma-70 factor (ECF subfamily)